MNFKHLARPAALIASVALALGLAACSDDDAPVAPVASISGTAAVGNPLASATVTVQCAQGESLASVTGSNGNYSVSLTGGQTFPCVVTVTGGTPAVTLRSIAQAEGNVNVTPLTNLVFAAAAGSDPSAWLAANSSQLATKLAELVAKLPAAKAAIRASLTAAGYTVPAGDFITAAFEAKAGDPEDDLLEALAAGLESGGTTYAQLVAQVAGAGTNATTFPVQTVAGFDSLPSPFPNNMPSYGFEAEGLTGLGDKITFAAGTPRKVHRVVVAMSSWACQTGAWNTADCVSAVGATFTHPVTLSVYAADGTTVLATKTQTFTMPYRPSTSAGCADGKWKAADNTCNNGLAFKIAFDLADVTLPDTVVYKLSYNTRTYGASPMGATGPYDSLNVGAHYPIASPVVGTDVEPGTLYRNGSTTGSNEEAALMVRFDMVP